MEYVTAALDALILFFLVFTWFFEGNHKKCLIETVCPDCLKRSETDCDKHVH